MLTRQGIGTEIEPHRDLGWDLASGTQARVPGFSVRLFRFPHNVDGARR